MNTARRPTMSPRATDNAADASDCHVASMAEVGAARSSRSPRANAAPIAMTVPLPIKNATGIPSMRPSIRNTIAPTHIWNITDAAAIER